MTEEAQAQVEGEASPANAEEAMHIHRPKPLHGVREILTEIAVVVIGIAVALGGEQALEALHWRHQTEASETALKVAYVREVNNMALRKAQGACVAARLVALSAILEQASANGRLPPIGDFGRPPSTPWTIGAWDSVVASQTVSHLPRQKMLAYTAIAQETAYLSGLGDSQEDEWTTLQSMAGPARRLSDVEAENLRVTLAKAVNANRHMETSIEHLRGNVRATELVAEADFEAAARKAAIAKAKAPICQPMAAAVAAGPG